eukprot:TRINITY_DN6657_c0_g1_i6.p1 TRINITY_DN6657_c0_g1~~TRINITY_DN6657_c0_g1_i6.p1  ORF type:complete len:124 (+),score=40.35 TRINITY_DN6657_c0_g1_i6:33-374(+)
MGPQTTSYPSLSDNSVYTNRDGKGYRYVPSVPPRFRNQQHQGSSQPAQPYPAMLGQQAPPPQQPPNFGQYAYQMYPNHQYPAFYPQGYVPQPYGRHSNPAGYVYPPNYHDPGQ